MGVDYPLKMLQIEFLQFLQHSPNKCKTEITFQFKLILLRFYDISKPFYLV
jgi:hypothetical protein